MQVGDPFVFLEGAQVGDGLSEHVFECPGSCSQLALDEPVTILRESLHMHASGASMYNHLYRDGNLMHTSSAQFFDFEQQGSQQALQQPYEVLPGDSFKVECWYRNGNAQNRTFGLGSSNEMCISFLFYYPRVNLGSDFGDFPWYCGFGFGTYNTRYHVQYEVL
jgi:hypothetical protein